MRSLEANRKTFLEGLWVRGQHQFMVSLELISGKREENYAWIVLTGSEANVEEEGSWQITTYRGASDASTNSSWSGAYSVLLLVQWKNGIWARR